MDNNSNNKKQKLLNRIKIVFDVKQKIIYNSFSQHLSYAYIANYI